MSRLGDLIRALCPDGVPFVTLGDAFEMRNGYTPSKSDATQWTDGTVPWFRMDDIRENGRVLGSALQTVAASAVKGGRLYPANSIIFATSATIGEHALVTVPFLCNQRFTVVWPKQSFADTFDMKFVFYYGFVLGAWCKENTTQSSFQSVDMAAFKGFKVPVPPLAVQREIVRILDTFTDLGAELEAELEARRRQYSHYRHQLIEEAWLSECVPLGGVAEIRAGWGFPLQYQGQSAGDIPFYKVSDMNSYGNGVEMGKSANYVSEDVARRLGCRPSPAGTLVFPKIGAAIATNKKRVLTRSSAYDNNVFGVIPGERLLPRYLYFLFGALDLSRFASDSGAVPSIRKSTLAAYSVPVPPLQLQAAIVGVLDALSGLVSDISIGLPAELAARRKQYEYYRDKLLTFSEAS